MPENFLEINGSFALKSYCNTIGQSNNAFSILGFSFGGKTKSPCFDLFIHWLMKQMTNTYRNHFSRSNENRSIKCLENLNSLNSNAKAATGVLKGVPANQGQNSTEKLRRRHSPSTENRKRSHSLSAEDKISQAEGANKALKGTRTGELAQKPCNIGPGPK